MITEKKLLDIIKSFEDASYRAYSDITADERCLHGNTSIVVNLETAKAIVQELAEKLPKMSECPLEIELESTCSKEALIELLESTIEGVRGAEARKLKIKMEIKQLE